MFYKRGYGKEYNHSKRNTDIKFNSIHWKSFINLSNYNIKKGNTQNGRGN
jgi:hypothetical protein